MSVGAWVLLGNAVFFGGLIVTALSSKLRAGS
jgi:hypothetical protein